MSSAKSREVFKLALIVLWLVFTVTFAIWWFTFSVDHINTLVSLVSLQPDRVAHWERQKRMVFWEGSTWLVLLILGGAALIALVQKEKLRVKRIKGFFASFSHEVKTSLASLRIQAEALKDDLGQHRSPILDRLIGDTVRLQLQLENSLFFASQDGLQLFAENVDLSALVQRMREQWPNLQIEFHGSGVVHGDERALRTIFSNLVQNAHVHGKATKIEFKAQPLDTGRIRIQVRDNGRGFDGETGSLGELFHRPKPTSGSGLGLHICRLLIFKMGGTLELTSASDGFRAELELPGVNA